MEAPMNRNLKMPWSVKDTVENMECIRNIMIKKVRAVNLHGKAEEDVKEVNFDFNRVKKALQKQIPMKPKYIDEEMSYYECGNCGTAIYYNDMMKSHKYCLHCGQSIDWKYVDQT